MAVKSGTAVAALVLRIGLGALFAWTGGEKLFRLDDFTRNVANYQVVMAPWDAVVAYTLPWFELVAGAMLLAGIWVRGALVLVAGMTTVFIFGIAQAWHRGLAISCGCFGKSDEVSNYPLHLVALALMLGVVAFLLVAERLQRGHVFGGKRLKLPGRGRA